MIMGRGGGEELGFCCGKNEKKSEFHTGVLACGGKLLLLEIRGNALLPIVSMFLHKTIFLLKSWGREDLTLGGWFLNSGITLKHSGFVQNIEILSSPSHRKFCTKSWRP